MVDEIMHIIIDHSKYNVYTTCIECGCDFDKKKCLRMIQIIRLTIPIYLNS